MRLGNGSQVCGIPRRDKVPWHPIPVWYKHRKPLVLEAYSDSDWAGKLAAGRRSRSGWVVRYGDSPISWYSGIQKVVTQSSAEAEYVAISLAANEVVYLRNVLAFLNFPQPDATVIYEDNGAAIVWTKHYSADHSRSKHVDVRYHRIRHSGSYKKTAVFEWRRWTRGTTMRTHSLRRLCQGLTLNGTWTP